VNLLNLVDDKIKYLYEFTPCFHIRSKYENADKYGDNGDDTPILFYWNNGEKVPATPFSLLPQSDFFDDFYAYEMQLKQICLLAANGDVALSMRFYEDTDILEVYDFYILTQSYNINK
jgi:hypothetical protein